MTTVASPKGEQKGIPRDLRPVAPDLLRCANNVSMGSRH
jgi:hypothetical protein